MPERKDLGPLIQYIGSHRYTGSTGAGDKEQAELAGRAGFRGNLPQSLVMQRFSPAPVSVSRLVPAFLLRGWISG